MWDCAFDNGVSLFDEPVNGLKGNFYEPFVCGFIEEIEKLAEVYYFSYGAETQKKFLYYARLTGEQRRAYKRDKEVDRCLTKLLED